jgi:hypothetical protein
MKKEVPVSVIQGIVSEVSGIPLHNMLNKTRRHEVCLARQISIVLCVKYNNNYRLNLDKRKSDTLIMSRHNRDRTMIYYTERTISSYLDTHYEPAVSLYQEAIKRIDKWRATPISRERVNFIKKCICNHTPLEIRQKKLYQSKTKL